MTSKAETTTLNGSLLERMQDMNRSWLDWLREIRMLESHFGDKLLTAKTPSEAAAVCHEWMAKRVETVASEQQAFTTAWLGLISEAMKSASTLSARTTAQDRQ
jgi:hypothetical protein